jgi:hypothetical protein
MKDLIFIFEKFRNWALARSGLKEVFFGVTILRSKYNTFSFEYSQVFLMIIWKLNTHEAIETEAVICFWRIIIVLQCNLESFPSRRKFEKKLISLPWCMGGSSPQFTHERPAQVYQVLVGKGQSNPGVFSPTKFENALCRLSYIK